MVTILNIIKSPDLSKISTYWCKSWIWIELHY